MDNPHIEFLARRLINARKQELYAMIPEIKKILFTTDLSENSRRVFYYAATLASRFGIALIILHVKEKRGMNVDQVLSDFLGEEKWQELQREYDQEAKHVLIGKRKDYEIIQKSLDAFSRGCRSFETKLEKSDSEVFFSIISNQWTSSLS
jgi:hypothetical protein